MKGSLRSGEDPEGHHLLSGCRESLVIARNWDWQQESMLSTPLAETPMAGAELWPPQCAPISVLKLLMVAKAEVPVKEMPCLSFPASPSSRQ